MTPEQLRAKWLDCVGHGRPEVKADASGKYFNRGLALDREAKASEWLQLVMARR